MGSCRLLSTLVITLLLIPRLQGSVVNKSETSMNTLRYRLRNKVLHDLLISERCLEDKLLREKRDISMNSRSEILRDVELKFYDYLIDQLMECRQGKRTTIAYTNPETPVTTKTKSTLSATANTTSTLPRAQRTTTPIMTTGASRATTHTASTSTSLTTTMPQCKLQNGWRLWQFSTYILPWTQKCWAVKFCRHLGSPGELACFSLAHVLCYLSIKTSNHKLATSNR